MTGWNRPPAERPAFWRNQPSSSTQCKNLGIGIQVVDLLLETTGKRDIVSIHSRQIAPFGELDTPVEAASQSASLFAEQPNA